MRLRMGELSKLPEEMKVQVLSRLPPKSLMRFKCVHRSWHALISSSNFAAKHVSISKDNKLFSNTTVLFKRYVLDLNTERRHMVVSLLDLCPDDINCVDDVDDHLKLSMKDLHVPLSMGLKRWDIWSGIEYVDMACHCNGIICITDYRKRVVLCNPAIKEFNRLPVSSLALSCAEPQDSSTVAVGFGCDVNNEDYKVVRVLHIQEEFNNEKNDIKLNPPRAEVYSLATKCWKEINAGALDNGSVYVWPDSAISVYCKGSLYWRGLNVRRYIMFPFPLQTRTLIQEEKKRLSTRTKRSRIISFDIASETFHVLRYPNGYGCYHYYVKVFGLWNDSVAVSTRVPSCMQFIDIWVPDGVEESWLKCLCIEPVVNFGSPLAFVGKSGQSILVATDGRVVVLYDFTTAKWKYLPE